MKKYKILITGGAGFLGTQLVKYILEKTNYDIVIFDRLENHKAQNYGGKVIYYKGDISANLDVKKVFEDFGPFQVVFHLASAMPDKSFSDAVLWRTNVIGTKNLITEAAGRKLKSFVFTSSNVAYGIPKELPVTEETPLNPLEIYGKSKAQAESELKKFKKEINIQIFRCPVISGIGRLGLQSILFEFISENHNVYILGDGSNKYQFVDVMDVCSALEKSSHIKGFDVYNIGADEIVSVREIYSKIIAFAKSRSRIISLPKAPAFVILSILERLNISPLGVYQYTMLGKSMYADTKKIKTKLKWVPKKTNSETFMENYKWYIENKNNLTVIGSDNFSSNRSLPKMGIFKLLKMLS